MKPFLLYQVCPLIIISISCGPLKAQPAAFRFTENKMGAPFNISISINDGEKAAAIAANCYQLVDSLVLIFSDYIDSSELNRLSATAGQPEGFTCSPALFEILQQSATAWKRSDGSFDISLGPLTSLWRKARRSGIWPTDSLVQATRKKTGFNKIRLNDEERKVWLTIPGMQLDLGGIAQGYIAKAVLQRATALGAPATLVDVSGDICAGDPPNGRTGWVISINLPGEQEKTIPQQLQLSRISVTTSGDAFQYYLHEGKKYSHVINPATGYGTTEGRNCTVLVEDAVLADWLTKAVGLLSIREAKKLAQSLNAGMLIARSRKGKVRLISNRRFRQYLINRAH